jgi:hypothetical protein
MKNLHYLFVPTLLFTISYSCKTDSIDACDTNCSKCVVMNSKDYNEKNELTSESTYEYDNNLNATTAKTVNYSKGIISKTEIIEYENVYVDKLLIKKIQKISGQINTTTIYSYHANSKIKRTEKINKENVTFSIVESNDSGKSVYYYYRNTPPFELLESKWTFDNQNNELSFEDFSDGNRIYSSNSEYNSDNSLSKKIEKYNYKNQMAYSRTSIYNYDLAKKISEINYQYSPVRIDADKTVYTYSIDKSKISRVDYLGKTIQYQVVTEYNEKGSPIKVSTSSSNNPLLLEIRGEYNYYPSGKLKQQISTVNSSWNQYISYGFDENSNLISVEFLDSSKKVIQKTISTYSCVK